MRTKLAKFLCTSIMAMLLFAAFPLYAYGNGPNEPHDANAMWVEPSCVDLSTDTYTVGYKFNVTVWLNITTIDVGDYVAAWQFVMLYNKAHLDAIRCGYTAGDKSQFFEDITTLPVTPQFVSYNDTHNYVVYGESWLFGAMREPGYGSLSWVEFNVTAIPPEGEVFTSLFDISTRYMTAPPETKVLSEEGATRITFDTYDSVYVIPEFPYSILAIFISLTFITVLLTTKLRKPKLNKSCTRR